MPSLQWEVIDRLKPTSIVAVLFIVKLIQYAKDNGININTSSVKSSVYW